MAVAIYQGLTLKFKDMLRQLLTIPIPEFFTSPQVYDPFSSLSKSRFSKSCSTPRIPRA